MTRSEMEQQLRCLLDGIDERENKALELEQSNQLHHHLRRRAEE